MKILKLLNKKNLSIITIYLLSSISVIAEDKPIDIWNIEKKEVEAATQEILSSEKISENSIYKMQTDKKKNSIKLDQELDSKEIKIAGLYDPEEYGLSINMWSNSDGLKLRNLFDKINKYNLSKDASEILNISMLTNAYYPNQNITEQEFLNFKSEWLIKDSNFELIEKYLIKNQIINLHPNLTRYLVDRYLSQSNLKKSCEIFSNINEPIEDDYLDTLQNNRSKLRIPFGSLVELGIIKPGTTIFDNKKKISAKIMADGSIKHAQTEGSIHKVAATILGAESCNGWTYWHYNLNGAIVPIDHLRQRLVNNN